MSDQAADGRGVGAEIVVGDCRDMLVGMAAESVDAVVTDPPYFLGFMNKGWDTEHPAALDCDGLPGTRGHGRKPGESAAIARQNCRASEAFHRSWADEALRVLKPGAYLLAFGGSRTFHRLACAVEDAGFEIRDTLCWLYGSGMPKTKTTLKPAWEPVIVARKPCAGSEKATVAAWGTGGLQIDACRISGNPWRAHDATGFASKKFFTEGESTVIHKKPHDLGRWPANILLDESAAALLDAQSGELTAYRPNRRVGAPTRQSDIVYGDGLGTQIGPTYADTGGASRFFYVAKASRRERNAGLEGMPAKSAGLFDDDAYRAEGERKSDHTTAAARANHHPTVKPVALMRWLCRLVTPPGGLILDLFAGSGSTGCAAVLEGFDFLGIEMSAEYAEIARRRIAHWARQPALPLAAVAD